MTAIVAYTDRTTAVLGYDSGVTLGNTMGTSPQPSVTDGRHSVPCGFEGCFEWGHRVYIDTVTMENPPAKHPPGTALLGRRYVTSACREHAIDLVGVDVGELP